MAVDLRVGRVTSQRSAPFQNIAKFERFDAMITIVDYQMGNLRSVQKGIERVGGQASITSDPREIARPRN